MSSIIGVAFILVQCSFVVNHNIYIIPSSIDQCPSAASSCITLSELAANTSDYVRNHSNVTVIFQPGDFIFNTQFDLVITSKDNVSFVSSNHDSFSTTVHINCLSTSSFTFTKITYLYLSGIQFMKCNGHQFSNIKILVIENCRFFNHSSTALNVANTSVSIRESQFLFNSNGSCLRYMQSEPLCANSGGAIVLMSAQIDINNTRFEGNSAEIGGAIFSFDTYVTVHNSSFVSNTAVYYSKTGNTGSGGVFALSDSEISIQHCKFVCNKADRKGGVLFTLCNTTRCFLKGSITINTGIIGIEAVTGTETVTIMIINSQFVNNNGGTNGGVVEAEYTIVLQVSRSTFINNTAHGVIRATDTLMISSYVNNKVEHKQHRIVINIIDSKFTSNYGASLYLQNSTVTCIRCLFVGNHGCAIKASSTVIKIFSCRFANNSAARISGPPVGALYFKNAVVHIQNSTISENKALKDGGGLCSIESNVIITNSILSNNVANVFGGAVYVYKSYPTTGGDKHIAFSTAEHSGGIISSTYPITIRNTLINGNRASQGVVYVVESLISLENVTISYNKGTLFAINSKMVLRALVVHDMPLRMGTEMQEGGAITCFQSEVFFQHYTILTNNQARSGGAIHAIESKLHVLGTILVKNNTATDAGGGIYLYQSELICTKLSSLILLENQATEKGGGIYAFSSTIKASYYYNILQLYMYSNLNYSGGLIRFTQNMAKLGGAIFLEAYAQLYALDTFDGLCNIYDKFYTYTFKSNSAEYGGAIYINDISNSFNCDGSANNARTTSECFVQLLSLRGVCTRPYTFMLFENNFANTSGHNVYGGLLDRCFHNRLSKFSTDGLTFLKAASSFESLETITSEPVRVCFCRDAQLDCKYQPSIMTAKKGENFTIQIAVVDQVEHPIVASVRSKLKSSASGVGGGLLLYRINDTCSTLTFNIFSPHDDEQLSLYPEGPCNDAKPSLASVDIQFSACRCLIGFQEIPSETNCLCECDERLRGHIDTQSCNPHDGSFLKVSDAWIGYTENNNYSDYLIHPHCPLQYCKQSNVILNLNQPKFNGLDDQCVNSRSGLLCGICKHGLSLSLGSSLCLPCPTYWPVIFLAIIITAIIAGMFLVVLFLILNLTVAIGTLNGIIFYANIIAAYNATFFSSLNTRFTTVFVAWLNFEIGFDTCFIQGLDIYWKTLLQLAFPSYVIFLVVIVIIACEKSRRFAKLIGKKDPVATLATLILLSYAKFLNIIIVSFSYTILHYPSYSGPITVWLPDATVKFLQGKHIVLFVIALFILLVGVVYTFVLFSWQWLLRFSETISLKIIKFQKLVLFIETYHIPYTPSQRYWTGLLLIIRVILYITSAANVSGDPRINLLSIGVVTVCLLLLKGFTRVYKKLLIEILEVINYANLVLLCIMTFMVLNDERGRVAITTVSVSITFLLLVTVLVYHVYTEVLVKVKTSIVSKLLFKKSNSDSLELEESTMTERMSTPPVSSVLTHSVVDAPKRYERVCSLRESLLKPSEEESSY